MAFPFVQIQKVRLSAISFLSQTVVIKKDAASILNAKKKKHFKISVS